MANSPSATFAQNPSQKPSRLSVDEITTSLRTKYPRFCKTYETARGAVVFSLELLVKIIAAIIAFLQRLAAPRKRSADDQNTPPAQRTPTAAASVKGGVAGLGAAPAFSEDVPEGDYAFESSAFSQSSTQPSATPSDSHDLSVEDVVYREVHDSLNGLSASEHHTLAAVLPAVLSPENIKRLAGDPDMMSDQIIDEGALHALGHDPLLSQEAQSRFAHELDQQAKSALHTTYREKTDDLQNSLAHVLSTLIGEEPAKAASKFCIASLPDVHSHGLLDPGTLEVARGFLTTRKAQVDELVALKTAIVGANHLPENDANSNRDFQEKKEGFSRPKQ